MTILILARKGRGKGYEWMVFVPQKRMRNNPLWSFSRFPYQAGGVVRGTTEERMRPTRPAPISLSLSPAKNAGPAAAKNAGPAAVKNAVLLRKNPRKHRGLRRDADGAAGRVFEAVGEAGVLGVEGGGHGKLLKTKQGTTIGAVPCLR
jgi:hypothetical protein